MIFSLNDAFFSRAVTTVRMVDKEGKSGADAQSSMRRTKHTVGFVIIFVVFITLPRYRSRNIASVSSSAGGLDTNVSDKTLVTYAYAEGLGNGGKIDVYNFRYFLKVAVASNTPGTEDIYNRVDYNIVVSGSSCTPCEETLPGILRKSYRTDWVRVLYKENFGMDFGGYNVSISWVKRHFGLDKYKYYVFINSSMRGPFMPKWTPRTFHYTEALTNFFKEEAKVKLAGSYVTCLPQLEPQPGPILESLFFAVDHHSLRWLISDGVFDLRAEKADAILSGEYALLKSITSRGGYVEGLSMRYAKGIDWRDFRHHHCNDNRHSSRRGSLSAGVSPNPLEHIFLKTSWCVRATETSVYSNWLTALSNGQTGTQGELDMNGYLRGISVEGTSGKAGTLPDEISPDGCKYGDIKSLFVLP